MRVSPGGGHKTGIAAGRPAKPARLPDSIDSMPDIPVHLPEPLFSRLKRAAAQRGISRDELIVESCRRTVEEWGRWPEGFFANDHLSDEDLELLRRDEEDFRKTLESARRSRTDPPF